MLYYAKRSRGICRTSSIGMNVYFFLSLVYESLELLRKNFYSPAGGKLRSERNTTETSDFYFTRYRDFLSPPANPHSNRMDTLRVAAGIFLAGRGCFAPEKPLYHCISVRRNASKMYRLQKCAQIQFPREENEFIKRPTYLSVSRFMDEFM